MSKNLVVLPQRENDVQKEKFIELTVGTKEQVERVAKRWKVSVIEGYFKQDGVSEVDYAVRLISTLNGRSATFKKADFEDKRQASKICRKLSSFGHIEQNFIKLIAINVNEALYEQPKNVMKVGDLSNVWLDDITYGAEDIKRYYALVDFITNNKADFPTRSSGKYEHEKSAGAILDHRKVNKFGYHSVGILPCALREFLDVKNKNEFHEILKRFLKMGVLQGKLTFRTVEDKSKDGYFVDDEYFVDEYSNVMSKVKVKAKRLDPQVTLKPKGNAINVFIFDIDFNKGGLL